MKSAGNKTSKNLPSVVLNEQERTFAGSTTAIEILQTIAIFTSAEQANPHIAQKAIRAMVDYSFEHGRGNKLRFAFNMNEAFTANITLVGFLPSNEQRTGRTGGGSYGGNRRKSGGCSRRGRERIERKIERKPRRR